MFKRARVWQGMDGGMGMQRERRSQFVGLGSTTGNTFGKKLGLKIRIPMP
jgi:hypothetical protein